jgi:hypothetical protein
VVQECDCAFHIWVIFFSHLRSREEPKRQICWHRFQARPTQPCQMRRIRVATTSTSFCSGIALCLYTENGIPNLYAYGDQLFVSPVQRVDVTLSSGTTAQTVRIVKAILQQPILHMEA